MPARDVTEVVIDAGRRRPRIARLRPPSAGPSAATGRPPRLLDLLRLAETNAANGAGARLVPA